MSKGTNQPAQSHQNLHNLQGFPPNSQWNLGVFFFPNFERKYQSSKKKKFFFFEDWDFHSVNTHTSYMVTFSFNLMAIVCVIANFFLFTKNDIIVHFNKFPNLGVYQATFSNLKGPRAPSKNCRKIPDLPIKMLNQMNELTI